MLRDNVFTALAIAMIRLILDYGMLIAYHSDLNIDHDFMAMNYSIQIHWLSSTSVIILSLLWHHVWSVPTTNEI